MAREWQGLCATACPPIYVFVYVCAHSTRPPTKEEPDWQQKKHVTRKCTGKKLYSCSVTTTCINNALPAAVLWEEIPSWLLSTIIQQSNWKTNRNISVSLLFYFIPCSSFPSDLINLSLWRVYFIAYKSRETKPIYVSSEAAFGSETKYMQQILRKDLWKSEKVMIVNTNSSKGVNIAKDNKQYTVVVTMYLNPLQHV